MTAPDRMAALAAADLASLGLPRRALLDEPLDYVLADHLRQRALGAVLRRFAEAGWAERAQADATIAFMANDLAHHHDDEDEDLFPLLRKRAWREDDLGGVLARLGEDHTRSVPMAAGIIAALAADPAEPRQPLDGPARDLLRTYAASEHRHLAVENAVVLPLARVRLRRGDLEAMSLAMKQRRGA